MQLFAILSVTVCFFAGTRAESAALVIGGFQSSGSRSHALTRPDARAAACGSDAKVTQLTSVEVYNCPDSVYPMLNDLEAPLTLASGVYWPLMNSALLCGGVDCYEGEGKVADETDACKLWNPVGEEWLSTKEVVNLTPIQQIQQ